MKTIEESKNEHTEIENLKARCDELQELLAALVKVCAMWPGSKNPEHFPEMKAARNAIAGKSTKHEFYRLRALKAEAVVQELRQQIEEVLPDLEHYASTHGAGPDVRLLKFKQVVESGRKLLPL